MNQCVFCVIENNNKIFKFRSQKPDLTQLYKQLRRLKHAELSEIKRNIN